MQKSFVLLVVLTAGRYIALLDVAAALERPCTPSHIVCTPSAHSEELPELSPFEREMRRSPLTVLSPPERFRLPTSKRVTFRTDSQPSKPRYAERRDSVHTRVDEPADHSVEIT